ncbi:fido domain-containing protein [Coniella lustricola]|uniref:Fido domain-containing protein n=1 Tax=Coniella lustricola TaxID=2025994 RepID=A0A2T3AAH7_9PEZI|nr:fido domain-containing protein [Coniella lustricola]
MRVFSLGCPYPHRQIHRTKAQVVITYAKRALDANYNYNTLGNVDPDDLFDEFQADINDITAHILSIGEQDKQALEMHYIDVLYRIVFGLNQIENAGASLDITYRICKRIFKGEGSPKEITKRNPDYQALKIELQKKKMPSNVNAVLRTRREIVQHAKATQHIIHEVAVLDKDITEELILKTHGFLTYKVDCPDSDLNWKQYSGVYRSTSVVAGFSAFPPPAHVPRLISAMVVELNADLARAVEDSSLDPVMLSAKYCHRFVNIHPFVDRNGRTCRLILNAILLKYCGLIVTLGEGEDDRTKYLEIAATGSLNEMSDLDDHDDNMPNQYWKELATFTLSHTAKNARSFLEILKQTD